MKFGLQVLGRSFVIAVLVTTSVGIATGSKFGLPFTPSVAHACSESIAAPQLSQTILGDGNKYIVSSVSYSCVPTNHKITTWLINASPGCGCGSIGDDWYPDPSGSGTHNSYHLFVTSGTQWKAYAFDDTTGIKWPDSQVYTTN